MTLKLNTVRAVVKVHVTAKFHQAACSGSWVIAVTEKKNWDEYNTVRHYHEDSYYHSFTSEDVGPLQTRHAAIRPDTSTRPHCFV